MKFLRNVQFRRRKLKSKQNVKKN
jgi:hypothetical protein